jgi:hypothetical protein
MKRILVGLLLASTLAVGSVTTLAQDKSAAQKFEYAMIKWDGPDKVQYILPDKFEFVRLGAKFPLPKDAQPEEYYLTIPSNELAKQGWEALNIDSRRTLFRRPVGK